MFVLISNLNIDKIIFCLIKMTDDYKDITDQELNKAINFLGQNKFSEAESVCNDIISKKNNSDAYHILSSIKLYNQDFNEAIKLVKKSIKINNENPGYHVTLGCAYSASKEYESSIVAFKKAISLNSKVAQVHFYLGESYRQLKKHNDSLSSFYQSIELSPDYAAAYLMLGLVYQEKKQFDLSIQSFQKCIEIMPDYAEAHLNAGLCYLLIGDYKNGWKEYEWRKQITKLSIDNLNTEWTGQNLNNKTLLVLDEGDENLIHFVRFVRELHKDNCKIILQCSDLSMELMSKQKWINEVVSTESYPDHDYQIQMGSLMNVLQIDPNKVIQGFPYINIEKKEHEYIKTNKLNIGLLLETNTNSNAHEDESIKSNVMFDVFNEKHHVIYLDSNLKRQHSEIVYDEYFSYENLDELSNLILNLDIVITVDHLVAHVAGALDINTVLMLPCVPNWRWEITHRNSSPWYKSVKLYRQETPGDWNSVVKKVKGYLEGYTHV